jgi:hypothetical protein
VQCAAAAAAAAAVIDKGMCNMGHAFHHYWQEAVTVLILGAVFQSEEKGAYI